MNLSFETIHLTKRFPLTISRGTSAGSENLLLTVSEDGVFGWGEMAPVNSGSVPETAETGAEQLERCRDRLAGCSPWELQKVGRILDDYEVGRAARAALECALYDWQGKTVGQPVWRLFGLDRSAIPLTSVTIGINPPAVVRERVPEILARTGVKVLKVKLGSSEGLDADREMFSAAQGAATQPVIWRVDANGGWDIAGAREMVKWLAARNVEFVEQPLPRGQEAGLAAVHEGSPLPIYVDESVRVAADIPPLAAHVDGVNLKLMKCGGLREAIRIVHVAKAHGLRVMMGCFSESSLAITAAAHISPLADDLDLDSHLNLLPDPFIGALWTDGRIVPGDEPGLGVHRNP